MNFGKDIIRYKMDPSVGFGHKFKLKYHIVTSNQVIAMTSLGLSLKKLKYSWKILLRITIEELHTKIKKHCFLISHILLTGNPFSN